MNNPLAQTRRDARERAIELAYESEQRAIGADALLAGLVVDPDPYAALLLKASELQRTRAETLIAERARGWSLDRMPLIDRLVMRMAVAEMITTDTPTGVILAEAVALVGRYSTDESTRFVNGVLSAIAADLRP
ncbi:MAG: transcription antitermination factor NusB [Acidimicrobiales bacterium]